MKSRQKLAETPPGLILASMQLAQTDVYYYGYLVYDPVADYYYWFTADVVIELGRLRPITNHVGSLAMLLREHTRSGCSSSWGKNTCPKCSNGASA